MHSGYETINTVMDVVLLLVSFWMAYTAKKMNMGGAIGKTVSMVVYGAIVLGFAFVLQSLPLAVVGGVLGIAGAICGAVFRIIDDAH